ncbi:helix-turn-helix domain-containing protein [Actinomadura harenae]|uniref:AraC family transcriptional regulator n=1 Tax=Actinomadura harenae TaxID=2483351 RepID=A0A3M2LZF6_9ACTN|nr:helix-turn-helix domain-containing protein [Actinomadura harenae]RMI42576.1 AraC family transcriptional regulator [Actinomadura harenae]
MLADGLIEAVQDLSDTTGDGLVHLPDTATSLVFRRRAGGRGDLLVIGPRTRAAYFTGKELPTCVAARLRPGAARAALGVPVSDLVDRVVPLTDLWGADASRLERHLAADDGLEPFAGRLEAVAGRLEAALRARVAARRPDGGDVRLVHAAARELASARPTRLPDLAHRLAVSERRLRSLFTDGAGLPPKAFTRIARLRTALTMGNDLQAAPMARVPSAAAREAGGGRGLAEVAAVSGYYDQAHMSADFRSLLGVPPGAFFAGRLPAPAAC